MQDYEIYVRELKERLYKGFMEKSGDHNFSANLMEQVLGEFGVADIRGGTAGKTGG